MFARVKKTGQYQYLQIVQNRREGTKTIQRVVATIGRMDQIQRRFLLAVVEVEIFVWGIAHRTDNLLWRHGRFAPAFDRFQRFAVNGLIEG